MLNKDYDGHWYDPAFSGQGIDLRLKETPEGLLVFLMFYAPIGGHMRAWTGQGFAENQAAGNGSYVFDLYSRPAVGAPLVQEGRVTMKPNSNGTISGSVGVPGLPLSNRVWKKLIGVPVGGTGPGTGPSEPGPGLELPPYNRHRFNIINGGFTGRQWPDGGEVYTNLNTQVIDGELITDVWTVPITVHTPTGVDNKGRWYQNIDNGSLAMWFSLTPGGRELVDQDSNACGSGTHLYWRTPDGPFNSSAHTIFPGSRIYTNFAFIGSAAWKAGRVVGLRNGMGSTRASVNIT